MVAPGKPENEAQRIATLKRAGLLDNPPLERFERVTRLTRAVFSVPFALITLVDAERQWFLSRHEFKVEETPRDISFCAHAILSGETMVVLDAHTDPRFVDNPLVTGPPHIRFYAGHPLEASDGTRFGTLCLIDRQPWQDFTASDRQRLHDLAMLAEQEFKLTQASHLFTGESDTLATILQETVHVTGTVAVDPLQYERARNRIAALYEVTSRLLDPGLDIRPLAGALLEIIARADGWHFGALWLGSDVEGRHLSGFWAAPELQVPARDVLSGRTREDEGLELVGPIHHTAQSPRLAEIVTLETTVLPGQPLKFGGLHVPLRRATGQSIGILEVFRRDTSHPDDGEIKLLVVLAANIARFLEVREAAEELATAMAQEAFAREELATLRRLDQLKSDLVNSVSHELRTPLTVTTGYAELLKDGVGGELTPEQSRIVDKIQEATHRLERLVGDLLDFARLESGMFRLNCSKGDLCAVASTVDEQVQPLAQAAGVTLMLEVPAEPLNGFFDQARVEQVLTNFLTNAIKFSSNGGKIAIRCGRSAAGIGCSVSDAGPGIPPEDVSSLFQRFSQLAEGRRKGTGSGLGLFIARSIVEAHGGQVGVDSKVGEGSTFWFNLPPAPPMPQETTR